jgi:hypothetical protein
MFETATDDVLEETLARLVADALRRDVPESVAEEARAATRLAVSGDGGPAKAHVRRRASAYFSAVVRHRLWRRDSPPRATARLVIESVVADLRAAGRCGADIWDELQRGWTQRVPSDVLDEYRAQLCR